MVLRLPKTLLDASLLEDEPFKTCFASCRAEYSQRRRRSTPRTQHIDLVVDALGKEAGDLDAAILWITNGFNVKPTEAKDGRLLRIFVDFYWHLYFETESAACALLYTQCKARNLGYRPDIHATLPSIPTSKKAEPAAAAPSRSSRRKRRKQKKRDDDDGADVEDNLNDDHAQPSSASTVIVSTRTRHSARITAASTTGGGKANLPKTARKPKLPAYEPSESSLTELDSEKPVVVKTKRGRKRKSKKHGASSPSAGSTDDASKVGDSTTVAITAVPDCLSDCSTLTSLSSDDEPIQPLASLPAAYNDPPAEESVQKEGVILLPKDPVDTSTPSALAAPVSTAAAIPAPTVTSIETENVSASSTLDSPTSTLVPSSPPTAKVRKRKTQRGLEKPTRVMPGRVAARKDKLAALSAQEANYHERTRRGQYEDFEVDIPTVSAPPRVNTGSAPAPEKVDTTLAVQAASLCVDAESAPTTAPNPVKSVGRRKTAKKPRISQRMGGITVQVAKRRRRNDGTAAPLPIGAALADVMLKSVAKPRPTAPPETPTEPLQTEKSDEVAASHTRMTSQADVSISTAQKPRRGRKRQRAQAETQADPLQDPTPSIPPPTDRIIIRIPPRTRTSTPIASSSTPVPVYRPTVDASAVDTILRDAATNSLETLTCTEDPASDWEVDNLDEGPSLVYESDHDQDYAPKGRKAPSRKSSVYNRPAARAPSESVDYLPRKPLERYPPIWAESRQEVCESFDWFRSYQGGVYFIKGHVKGYLLGGFSASRDLFHDNGRLIISHGGGKAESIHKLNGQSESIEASDQREDDKSVGALLHTYRTKRPLVLLIDDKYRLFPFDISSKGCTYAILGWYHIAHAWAEYQPASNSTGKVVRYKFAFQWCEDQGQPWWGPSLQDKLSQADVSQDEPIANRQVCSHCGGSSPTVYAQGWMCLKSGCRAFYTFADGSAPPAHMTYAPGFLKPVPFSGEVLEELFPSLPGANLPADTVTTTRHFCKGWHCRSCGRLSSRFKWEYWECRNCGERHGKYGKLRTAEEFRYQARAKGFDRHWQHGSIIPSYDTYKCGNTFAAKVTFILPHGRGRIYLLLSHPLANKSADEILKKYQVEAKSDQLLFRRWPMRAHKCRGTLLTNYFSQNTGAPYQYVGGDANTVPFDRAPSAVVSALELINTRMQQAELGKVGFNEVLSAAYMEEQRMAFHSDSERGLGPTVASLSLGASAYMHFRLHARHAAEEMGDGSREVLKLFLRHGDVVVMEGAGVQECYEHTVVPLNFRIAATARLIGSEHH